jgi:hypothetical protein
MVSALWTQTVQLWMFMDVSSADTKICIINWNHQLECRKNKRGHSTFQTNKQKWIQQHVLMMERNQLKLISQDTSSRLSLHKYWSVTTCFCHAVHQTLHSINAHLHEAYKTKRISDIGVYFWKVLLLYPQQHIHHRRLEIPLNPNVLDPWLQVHVSPHIGCQLLAAPDSLQQPVATVSHRPLSRTCLSLHTLWRICSNIRRTLLPN